MNKIVKCEKCGAIVKVLICCTCKKCGIKCCNETMKECEEDFVKIYLSQLQQEFKFVINMPIKSKLENIPKHRMVFMTNYIDGIFLMCDDMNKRWKKIVNKYNRGQISFLPILPMYENVSEEKLKNTIMEKLKKEKVINYNLFMYYIIKEFGCSFSKSEINSVLKKLRKEKILKIQSPERDEEGILSKSGRFTENYLVIAE